MRRFDLILIILLIEAGNWIFAQQSILVPAGGNPEKLLPKSLRLLNPSFEVGHLVYVNDSETKSYEFNLDLYCSCIAFIKNGTDTSYVVHDLNIKKIKIGKDEYLNIQKTGFVKVLVSNQMYSLVSNTKLNRTEIQESVNIGYGSVPVRSVTSSVKSNRVLNDATFSRETEWLILDHRGSRVKADKKNFLKMFGDKEGQIRAFMKSHRINYENEEDLIKLFLICIAK